MYKNKSLLENYWKLADLEERLVLSSSQKNNISPFLAKLLLLRNVSESLVQDFLNPNIKNNIPNPFLLNDMDKSIKRTILALIKGETIGIIADYDVDGSTSASILYKFLTNFSKNIILKTPNRLTEGYGPNIRIMDEMLDHKVSILFTLDCGTSSFNIIDNSKYSLIDVIVIDHHLSELNLPKVYSVINPNRFDENSQFNQMAAVGVTFLFLMALRKELRIQKFFKKNNNEPNLFILLDLVALGTVCDVVNLVDYNRVFVKLGLELIKKRTNKPISIIIDNSNLKSTPNSSDLGFTIGPQLNAASRIDDSSLPLKLLTSSNIVEIESISRKLLLLNEKRKLIEEDIYKEALIQAEKQRDNNFILVYGKNWHLGVLGIVASKLIKKYYKPTIVISFNNGLGTGSGRSINSVDLGNLILNAKNEKILLGGGGHKMAAGLKIKFDFLNKFIFFLNKSFTKLPIDLFKRIETFDSVLSINEINNNLLEDIDKLEPFGAGNYEPKFIIKDLNINKVKILKEKHLLIFFTNDFSYILKGICFNCIGTLLGEYLFNFKNHKLHISCTIKKNYFNEILTPQIIIKDAMIIN